eukprot:TRINITY_DN21708_c0_g1_i5.p3 TRINITY_DN21708_c0_g1~~TRINITY_DN21708_c0_g1_i5.p3  ORF type:complete len:150 (+),score=12.54 TRINITY_DN21708_c0_g1_i5:28-477(+)
MAGCDRLFVYGTLLADEVIKVLLKRVPKQRTATLKGYTRYGIKGQVFPAIVPTNNKQSVAGQIMMGLSQKEMKILDEYESDEYFRELVEVLIPQEEEAMQVYVYVWRDQFRYLLDGNSWDYRTFRERHLNTYLANCHGWSEEIHAQLLQ